MKLIRNLVAVFLLLCPAAQAQNIVTINSVSRNFQPDLVETLIEFTIKPGWHIFAAYPQEFGMPLKISWNLPKESEILEESFSRTTRFDQEDFSYDGYENKLFYKSTIKISNPKNNMSAYISWQACAEECLNGHATIKIRPAEDSAFENALKNAAGYFVNDGISLFSNSLWFILMAFGGGVILNLMPCVFPILSIKIISLVRARPSTRRREALFYTSGVIVSMLAIAAVLFVLRLFYPSISWGFQMQSPWFVSLMLILFISYERR